jgi:hypothetical protein
MPYSLRFQCLVPSCLCLQSSPLLFTPTFARHSNASRRLLGNYPGKIDIHDSKVAHQTVTDSVHVGVVGGDSLFFKTLVC